MIYESQEEINNIEPLQFTKLTDARVGQYKSDITNIFSMKECRALEKLEIWYTHISDLPLRNTTKLKYINISYCKNLKNLNGLKNCQEIEEIYIESLNITSIAAIANLKQLKNLTIIWCEDITDYSALDHCSSLTYLWIQHTFIQNISSIANLQNIKTLLLTKNHRLLLKFQQDIIDNKEQVLKLLKNWKKTRQYQNYKVKKQQCQQKQKYHEVKASIEQTQLNFNQFKHDIKKMIYQYKINLIKSMKKIIQYQK